MKTSSSDDLRNAMLKIIENPDLASEMGNNAKLRARKLFNADKLAKEYLKIYSKFINSKQN